MGSDWTTELVVARFPGLPAALSPDGPGGDKLKMDVYRTEPGVFILNSGKRWYVTETRTCRFEQFKEAAAGTRRPDRQFPGQGRHARIQGSGEAGAGGRCEAVTGGRADAASAFGIPAALARRQRNGLAEPQPVGARGRPDHGQARSPQFRSPSFR
jgi:hypothetical protein